MIKIKIYGTRSDRRLKKLLSAAATHYLQELLPRVRKIRIKIQCIPNLMEKENVYGDCGQCGSEEPNFDYIIRIDNCDSYHLMLTTLAHEFIHIKQYVRRELSFYVHNQLAVRWKKICCSDYDYDLAPWEIEANSRELELYLNFFNCSALLDSYK
jgi:hypothetical protein